MKDKAEKGIETAECRGRASREGGGSLLFYIGWLGKTSLVSWLLGDLKKCGSKIVDVWVKSCCSRQRGARAKALVWKYLVCLGKSKKASEARMECAMGTVVES